MDQLFVTEQKRKAAQEKYNKWKQQKQIEEHSTNSTGQKLDRFAEGLVNKLNDPVYQIENSLISELSETNYCCVCLQMMLPPYKPMMLVPCGHNVCQVCLVNSKKASNIPIDRCPTCKTRIQTSSPNYSLMSLISRFKESQIKINKQNTALEHKVNAVMNNVETLRLRCSILEKERRELESTLIKQNRNVQVLELVQNKLQEQKRRVKKQLDALLEEEELLNRHIADNEHKLKLARVVAESTNEKYVVLENSLKPLLQEKQKAELLEVEKLLGSN